MDRKRISYLFVSIGITLCMISSVLVIVLCSWDRCEGDPDDVGGGFRGGLKNPELTLPPGDPDDMGGGLRIHFVHVNIPATDGDPDDLGGGFRTRM